MRELTFDQCGVIFYRLVRTCVPVYLVVLISVAAPRLVAGRLEDFGVSSLPLLTLALLPYTELDDGDVRYHGLPETDVVC